MTLRFDNIFLLHGKGGSPEGSARQLEMLLRKDWPSGDGQTVSFHRPRLLHADPQAPAEDSLADLKRREIPENALLIGISLGGLIAAKLQEEGRDDLHVICISSPAWADRVRVQRRMLHRIVFYSSHDEVIAGTTANWPRLAQAFDLPWLTHQTDAHKRELVRLILSYLSDSGSVPRAIQEIEADQK